VTKFRSTVVHLRPGIVAGMLAAALVSSACASNDASAPDASATTSHETTAAATSTTATVAPAVAPAGTTRDLTVTTPDGRTRTAHLYLPTTLPHDAPVPLLVALHGGTGSGRQFERQSNFDGIAEANRFLVVYPDGVGNGSGEDQLRTWNGGVCCGAAVNKDVDDVAFLRQLVEQVSSEYDVDAARVYATGHSNGMIMSYRLVCEAADVFVAAAGQAGTLGVDACDPAAPISFLHIHGAADMNIPIDGGRGEGISGVTFPSPRESVRRLAAADGCPADPATTTAAPTTTETWAPCAADTVIEFVTVAGATHAWMGAEPARAGAPVPFAGYDSSAAIWTFLTGHPRT
jgi:polyhydroxybutyrate depolymerase